MPPSFAVCLLCGEIELLAFLTAIALAAASNGVGDAQAAEKGYKHSLVVVVVSNTPAAGVAGNLACV